MIKTKKYISIENNSSKKLQPDFKVAIKRVKAANSALKQRANSVYKPSKAHSALNTLISKISNVDVYIFLISPLIAYYKPLAIPPFY